MQLKPIEDFRLETSSLYILAEEAKWDSLVLGFPCVQIVKFEIYDKTMAVNDFKVFKFWIIENKIGFVSCRLGNALLTESIFLESNDFRFIEMVLHPYLDITGSNEFYHSDILEIEMAKESDIQELQFIAENVFFNERFHVDPRLGSQYGNHRYGQWVANALCHPTQVLLKVSEKDKIIGFFIVENREINHVYWHLTAISTEYQGRGYGHRVWKSMMCYHADNSIESISTTISARNNRVLNLYSKLQFNFKPAEMTFHWVV